MHVHGRRVRLVQEMEGFKDEEAPDDGIGRGDGRDDIASHLCACANNG